MSLKRKEEQKEQHYEIDMNIERMKKIKVSKSSYRRSLFDQFPDEISLTILSFCAMDDIKSTRGWQTDIVRSCTATTSKLEAARLNSLDTLKWIHGTIYTTFTMDPNVKDFPENWTGK